MLQAKVDDCNKELNDVKAQMKGKKGPAYRMQQQKALQILKRRKMYEQQLGMSQNQQFNVDQVQFTSDTIQDTIATANALKAATEVQKEQMKKLDMNKLEDVYDDLADLMAEQEEINDVLGRDFQVGNYDEGELMDGRHDPLTPRRAERAGRRDPRGGVERRLSLIHI